MKRVLVFLLGIMFPIMVFSQKKCVFFEKMMKLEVEKTTINTTHSDFGPSIVMDELWHSAYTDEEIAKLKQDKKKGIYYNLYATQMNAKGDLEGKRELKLDDIGEGYHVSTASYCKATGELFVTLSNYENPDIRNRVFQKANIPLKIIILKDKGGKWTKISELPFNNPKYSVGHPTISESGDTLFFASDIPEKGFGKTDIYMTVRENGKWGEMINLGDKINTKGDDMFPFFYKGRILIYASDGLSSGGDLDLYHAGIMNGSVIAPSPINDLNSDGDDFAFVIHPTELVGYYTSDKSGGMGHDDIYKVRLIPGEYHLELVVKDRKTNELFPNPVVYFEGSLMTATGSVYKKELEFDSSYEVKTDVEGYMNDSKVISTTGKPFGVIRETLWVEKVEVGQKFELENIYYDFDKWDILPESEIELDKLVKIMKDNPSWKVELGSHTDCRGSDVYNEKLSQKRSDSAVGYIVNSGISKDRIIAKGYGEYQLVNHCDDGVPCSAAEHRKNRRTEFKILDM